MINILLYICGVPLAFVFLCMAGRILREIRMMDLKYREEYMEYSIAVREEIKIKFNMLWTLFYEAELFVYSNQNIIPNDKEFNKYREMFLTYFTSKLTTDEYHRYLGIFSGNTLRFNEHIDYMFIQKFQNTFIGPTIAALTEAVISKKSQHH